MPTTATKPRQSGMADSLAARAVAVSASSGSDPPGKPAQELIIRSMQITCARRLMPRLMLTRQQATRSIAQQAHHVVAVEVSLGGELAVVGSRLAAPLQQLQCGLPWSLLPTSWQRRRIKGRLASSIPRCIESPVGRTTAAISMTSRRRVILVHPQITARASMVEPTRSPRTMTWQQAGAHLMRPGSLPTWHNRYEPRGMLTFNIPRDL